MTDQQSLIYLNCLEFTVIRGFDKRATDGQSFLELLFEKYLSYGLTTEIRRCSTNIIYHTVFLIFCMPASLIQAFDYTVQLYNAINDSVSVLVSVLHNINLYTVFVEIRKFDIVLGCFYTGFKELLKLFHHFIQTMSIYILCDEHQF